MKSAFLLGLTKTKSSFDVKQITSSSDSEKYIRQFYHDDIGIYESFFILLLSRKNETIAYAKISQGGVAGTVVDVKIVMKYAIDCLASGIVLAHNHPSGNLHPSDCDIRLTRKIQEACKIMDISVHDHIILTEDGFYSFADEGKM